jgi:Secretion system C-terminal sorting domain
MKLFTFLLLTACICSSVYTQTFQWVNISPINFQKNYAYLHSPSVLAGDGNPVCTRLLNFKELYSITYYGDTKIEKINSSGTSMWADIIYGKTDVAKLMVDGENNVVGYGTFIDTLQFDTATLIHNGQGTGSFIFKTDGSGNLIWLKNGAGYITGNGSLSALESYGLNNILLGMSDYPAESRLLTLDADGNQVSELIETNAATIGDIKTDVVGNIWATGFAFQGPISFNGLDTTAPFIYTEYVVKYNSAGTAQWVDFIQDVTIQHFELETDSSGNGYLGGNLLDSTSFGSIHANGPQRLYDFFDTKIDPDGNFVWLNEIPPGNALGDGFTGTDNFLSCSKDGHTYLTGNFWGQIDFGDSLVLNPLYNANIFVLCYNPDGTIKWAKSTGADFYGQASSITSDEYGSHYLTGLAGRSFVFDTVSGTGSNLNFYLAKLSPDNVLSVQNGNNIKSENPYNFTLNQNYPNPFNPVTIIKYSVPTSETQNFASVQLKVYDMLGREVATLVNEEKPAGSYSVAFDGSKLSSGVYLYKLEAGNRTRVKKMVLLK